MDLATTTVLQTLVHTIVSHSKSDMAQAIVDDLYRVAADLTAERYDVEAGEVRCVAEAALVAQDNRPD